jgi:hypothetical protein
MKFDFMPLLTVMCSNLSGQLSSKTNFIGRTTQHGRMSSLMWQWEDCTTHYVEILLFFIKILSHVHLFILPMLTARREFIGWLNTRMYKHIHTFVLRGRFPVGNIFCFIFTTNLAEIHKKHEGAKRSSSSPGRRKLMRKWHSRNCLLVVSL